MTRRRFLARTAAVATGAVAGCTTALDSFFDPRDTTIGNNTDQAVHGSITVTDETEATTLDERYELDPADGDDDSIEYEDYLSDSGVYTVRIDLADGYSIAGNRSMYRDSRCVQPRGDRCNTPKSIQPQATAD